MRSRAFGELGFGMLVLLLGCQRGSQQDNPKPAESAAGTAAHSTPSAPAVPSGALGATSAEPTRENAPIVRAVQAWSDALDRHDLAALEHLYADPVEF